MKGTSHALIGAVTGLVVASSHHVEAGETTVLIGLGGLTGLVPDLDTGGKLRGTLTRPHTYLKRAVQLMSILWILYSIFYETGTPSYKGIGGGVIIFLLASMFKQTYMLLITGVLVFIGGYYFNENWLLFLGTYIFIASLTPHRSYTHSLIGLCFFSLIGYLFEQSVMQEGIFYTCFLSYSSHLVADSRLFPFNKRGVPLFLPFTSKRI